MRHGLKTRQLGKTSRYILKTGEEKWIGEALLLKWRGVNKPQNVKHGGERERKKERFSCLKKIVQKRERGRGDGDFKRKDPFTISESGSLSFYTLTQLSSWENHLPSTVRFRNKLWAHVPKIGLSLPWSHWTSLPLPSPSKDPFYGCLPLSLHLR